MAAVSAALNIAAPVQGRQVARRSTAAPAAVVPVRFSAPAQLRGARAAARVIASAAPRPVNSVATETASAAPAVKSEYELGTLTNWLLMQVRPTLVFQ